MSAIVHLIAGPPAARAGRLVTACRAAAREIGSALVLVPTPRHADQVRSAFGTGIEPNVIDLQAFADELIRVNEPALRPNTDTDRRLLLGSVLAELRERDLLYFAGIAETRGFVDNAYGYVSELAEAEVDYRQLLKANSRRRKGTTSKHSQAARIFELYQSRLASGRRVDPPERLHLASQLLAKGRRQPYHRLRSVFLVGFATFTAGQQKVIAALRKTVEHLWIEFPGGTGSYGSKFVRQWLKNAVGATERTDPKLDLATEPDASSHAPSRLLIEAAGELGEARLVARRIRMLLADGVRAERLLVVARNFTPARLDLFCEVFEEYGIPFEVEQADTLARAPAVAFLLRMLRVPELSWEFARVAAALRSSFFRPNWPEMRNDPEMPATAESLLRMLGETRGRDAYLRAIATWEHAPPEPLEDEDIEGPQRKRKQQLAIRCRPFLDRFFATWDKLGFDGAAETVVARLKAFADEIGLARVQPSDAVDLARFWRELDRWTKREASLSTRKPVHATEFARVLAVVASSTCREPVQRGGGVPLLSARPAAGLDCDYLFLVGLGEGSWPDLSPPASLLDDSERKRLRDADIPLPDPATRLDEEQFLFDTLVASPRRELVLSYPAVDERGQKLLQCSFLRELLAKSPIDSDSTTSQRMLLDGYFDQEPLSEAELRVRLTHDEFTNKGSGMLFPDLVDNLARAQLIARARFESQDFGAFDGELRHPTVAAVLAKRLGPGKVFSATALDHYVACPFRFLLQHVLRLEPLEDPSEEVAHTHRGTAFHRALARFHKRVDVTLREKLLDAELPDSVTSELVEQIENAVEEYAQSAPSRATAELWRLEGKRLRRAAARYRKQWQSFREPWQEKSATPTPHQFEVAFGLPVKESVESLLITVGEVEVRIGGRIDRVDLTPLDDAAGFWVIDYKTGRATNYSAAQVEKFEKLQLPLYALAVERVLLKGQPARPLGLAYWLVTDTGPKGMLPPGKKAAQSWLADAEIWPNFREQLEAWVATLATHIRAGDFPLAPRSEHCTDTCSFGPVCRIAQSRNTGKTFALELPIL